MSLNSLLLATDVPPIPAAAQCRADYDGRLGPMIDLAQAVPGTPPPQELLDRLGAAGRDPARTTYGPIVGDLDLREALAADIDTTYAASIGPGDLAITSGCNQAFFVTMLALARAGDAVILPVPWYFNHKMTLDMLGIAAVPLPCRAENGFVPSVAEARALISAETRAIVLVTPNNPTGATYPPAVIEAFQDLASETGLMLVIDETYRDFLPEGQTRPHDLFRHQGWRNTTIHLYSFSKSYAVPGYRLGAIMGDARILSEIGKILDCMTICPARVAQGAIAWAIEGIRDWRAGVRQTINRRAALFRDVIAASPGWSVSAIGAYFAYVRHPFVDSGEAAAARLARKCGIITLPGTFFGPAQQDHLRFAFANVDDGEIATIGERLLHAILPTQT
ncbi:aminotransferase [Lichenifustis flavocetrariae]|uniref:Aminotransferase n=1 Tax=Lichenifustis flavocetrariae TaxID=2949735 RepID=A0AA41Z615_9HYPH|nr:aminotransferase [Lichenifustis flavocetrariae]MCW6511153.1 aminotransferase [Lichenifustis flavocetrariae]